MPTSADRIQSDLTALARFTETPGQGTSRPAFSPSWRLARDYISAQLESIGCNVRIDALGNLHARPIGIAWDAPVWMSGSHLDEDDGVAGIVAVMEAFRVAREEVKIAPPLELVVWACSDSNSFGQGNISSRAFVGELSADSLGALKNPITHLSYRDAGEIHGVSPELLAGDQLLAGTTIGYIELHGESGSQIAQQDLPAACVSGFSGFRQYRCELAGAAAEVATTPMSHRRDALAGAAECISAIEKISQELNGDALVTVTGIAYQSDAPTSIVDQTVFTIDLHTSNLSQLVSTDRTIRKTIERIAEQRQLILAMEIMLSHPVVEMDERVLNKLRRSAHAKRVDLAPDMSSSVFHDAGVLAPHVPTAMLFVASPDAVVRPQDIADAATVLLETVKDRRLD